MCGIVGILSAQPVEDRDRLTTMRETLRHRGPDDAGTWWSSDGRVGLGHRRLSIMDLSPAGHQPMLDRQNELAIVFNGEIYNFADLRRRLQAKGEQFNSSSDTEVLLKAYHVWGVDCLNWIDGMFAFAIFDLRRRRLLLARDRAGEKPLFYWTCGSELRFASELKALMADPIVPREVDLDALNFYLTYGYVSGEHCLLRDVKKMPAGHALTVDMDSGLQCRWAYWDLPGQTTAGDQDAEELTTRIHELLTESVRQRLVADVPVGILLSGGLDSSLVTAVAASVSSAPVKTFTISFPGHGRFDEGPFARQVASHFGTNHTELVAETSTVDYLPELARQYDEPIADSLMVPTYIVSKLIRQHAVVALGGDGGDELFGGYNGHSWVQSMQRYRRWLPYLLRRPLGAVARRAIPVGRPGRNAALGFLSDVNDSIIRTNVYFDRWTRSDLFVPGIRERLQNRLAAPEEYKLSLLNDSQTPLRRMTSLDFRTYLTDQILVKVDRASMLASLEVRAPFLARSVVEFAYRDVPDSLRATPDAKKILLRRLASRLLPASLDLNRKQGFTMPLQTWFGGAWGEYVRNVLLESDAQVFRRDFVARLLAQQQRGYRHTHRLFAMTMFELWRDHYQVGIPST